MTLTTNPGNAAIPMSTSVTGTVALITGASSGIGEATARRLAREGAQVGLVARRRDRLESVADEIIHAGGTAGVIEADITDQAQAEAAVRQVVERFGRLDMLVNNAGLMLLGPVVGADRSEWDRMIAVNVQGMLSVTHAALPHLLRAADDSHRRVADIVNVSSIAGRIAWNGYGVYNLTKFGMNGFTESLRQEITRRHVRVGVLEPGGVATELGSHNSGAARDDIDNFYATTEVLAPDDVADAIAYMVTRPRHASIGELWIMPTDQA
jgi:NADP-dependent 3-hydroxy acid dehydrogenase YdfG